MSILAFAFVILSCLNVLVLSGKTLVRDFNVVDYGAVGDGYTENSQAFLRVWDIACHLVFAETANMIIPEGMTFLVNPLLFEGPCKPKEINFKIFGTIISPKPSAWKGIDSTQWLAFRRVSGLIVDGYGTINGRGSSWWSLSCKNNHREACITSAPTVSRIK
ncbi:Polygalacturonase [Thalictrum thalictroides]|uniref:Polygalacturonase n=1 Tax=Thalictrum thalictroides TaxID=46969 RepID=A0A7J6WNX3_THATH|nr:Polygalacturonase [Thalictrum thalictroides]